MSYPEKVLNTFTVQHYDRESCCWETASEHDTLDAAVLRAQLDRSDGIDARIRSPEQLARDEAARNVVASAGTVVMYDRLAKKEHAT